MASSGFIRACALVVLSILLLPCHSVIFRAFGQNLLSYEDMTSIQGAAIHLLNHMDVTSEFLPQGYVWTRLALSVGDVIIRLYVMGTPGGGSVPASVAYTEFVPFLRECWRPMFLNFAAYFYSAPDQDSPANVALTYYLVGYPSSLPPRPSNLTVSGDFDEGIWSFGLVSGFKDMPGSVLDTGSKVTSPDEEYSLIMQDDCNLVLYSSTNRAVWSSDTSDRGESCKLRLQDDGNLVIYEGEKVIWATNAYCQPQPDCLAPSILVLQNDCNLVVYRMSANRFYRQPVWASGQDSC